jgi:signal transduction histidine kinase
MEVEKLECSIEDLVGEVVDLLNINAQKKNVQISVNFDRLVPALLRTDPFRLKQILMNVVGNAVKFTDRGAIDLRVDWARNEPGELSIVVRDTGRGISALECEKLFRPFSQADASVSRRYGGTGLGLSFARELAQLLGGGLDLTWSEVDSGSEFTVRIHAEAVEGTRWLGPDGARPEALG